MPNPFLLQTIQFSISIQFSSIWLIDRTLSGATTLGQSGPGSDGNEGGTLHSWSSSMIGTSPSDCLVSYPGRFLGESYPSAEMQSMYSAAPATNLQKIILEYYSSIHHKDKDKFQSFASFFTE